jgi:hypothetical protein
MDSRIQHQLAQSRSRDLRAAGATRTQAGDAPEAIPATTPVTLRFAFPDDEEAIARLAALDSSDAPPMPVLLGEVGGHLRAALSLADGSVVADPFHHTVALVDLLRARATQLRGVTPRRRFRRVWGFARTGPRLSA